MILLKDYYCPLSRIQRKIYNRKRNQLLIWTRVVLKWTTWNQMHWSESRLFFSFCDLEAKILILFWPGRKNKILFAVQCSRYQFNCSKRRIRVPLPWQMTSVWLLQTLAATCPRLLISWPPAPDTECSLSQSEARILTRWPIRGQQLPGPCSPQSSPRAAYSYLRRRDLELEGL